ncbi:MAG: restriction endonuclease, SacI family [Caldilineaceae bacterium]|nr:restriction endonuclease, SacI family [Caldilineaceae bacterium]
MTTISTSEFVGACKTYLAQAWNQIVESQSTDGPTVEPLSEHPDLAANIRACLTSKIKTYHYVLPTQLLAKAVDHSLNAQSLQVAHDTAGSFDARTIAHEVIVPFDQANYRVLGGSPEPYVNNPVRVPAITSNYQAQQKNKNDWSKLITVLDAVQKADDPNFTQIVFEQVLLEVYKLLSNVHVIYPTPNRISLSISQSLLEEFLSTASGGERMEAVCTALFQTIAQEFGIFDTVNRHKVNAADASTGMLADIECLLDGEVVLLIEVKDRSLRLVQLDSKLDQARSRQITELLFLTKKGAETDEEESTEIAQRVQSEFASGQNIYITSFPDFAVGVLILFGERGRRAFVLKIGAELDRVNAGISHRRAWSQLLKTV